MMENESNQRWLELALALVCGALFGLGLVISGMSNPAKVLAFLDITGRWDPTLLVVMFAALAVTLPAFRWTLGRQSPLVTSRFALPAALTIDRRLIAGSALFGIGWGLVGLCPGPAVTDLITGNKRIVLFVAAMLVGAAMASVIGQRGARDASAPSARS